MTKIRTFAHILIMQKHIMRPWIYDFEVYKRNKQRNKINCMIMKICANVYVSYRYSRAIQSCYPCHFIFSSELNMFVLSTSFKFRRLSSILLKITSLLLVTFSINVQYNFALHSGHCAFIQTNAVAVFLIFLNAQKQYSILYPNFFCKKICLSWL